MSNLLASLDFIALTEIFVKNEVNGRMLDAIESPDDISDIDAKMESVSKLKKKALFNTIKALKESAVPISMLVPPAPLPSNLPTSLIFNVGFCVLSFHCLSLSCRSFFFSALLCLFSN